MREAKSLWETVSCSRNTTVSRRTWRRWRKKRWRSSEDLSRLLQQTQAQVLRQDEGRGAPGGHTLWSADGNLSLQRVAEGAEKKNQSAGWFWLRLDQAGSGWLRLDQAGSGWIRLVQAGSAEVLLGENVHPHPGLQSGCHLHVGLIVLVVRKFLLCRSDQEHSFDSVTAGKSGDKFKTQD